MLGPMGGVLTNRHYLRDVELALVNAPFGGDWREAMAMIATATGSRGSDLVSLGGPLPSLNMFTGYDQRDVDAFDDPMLWGECNWRVGTATTPFQIQHEEHYRAYRERFDTRLYDEVAHASGMPFGCQTVFAQDEIGFLGLALLRSERDGPCTPEIVARFDRLCRVTARSIKVEATLAGEGAALALGAMDIVGKAVVLLNRHGWRCAISPDADAILTAGWPLQSARERIRLTDRRDDYRFQQLLGFLLSAPPAALTASLMSQGWRIEMAQLPVTVSQLAFEASLAIVITPDRAGDRQA